VGAPSQNLGPDRRYNDGAEWQSPQWGHPRSCVGKSVHRQAERPSTDGRNVRPPTECPSTTLGTLSLSKGGIRPLGVILCL